MFNPFEYHKPSTEEIDRIEKVRLAYSVCLNAVVECVKMGSTSGRYVALAKTALEESAMWATKSIVFERDNT